MKILHTDKNENPAIELPAEQFLNEAAKTNVIELIPDGTTVSPQPAKAKNSWLWPVVIIVLVLLIAAVVYYFKIKKQKENEHSGN